MVARTRSGRLRRPVLAALLLAAVVVPVVSEAPSASASPQDQLAQKQKLAQQLEAKIAASNERISVLDEEYNQAQLAIDGAAAGIADTQARPRTVDPPTSSTSETSPSCRAERRTDRRPPTKTTPSSVT